MRKCYVVVAAMCLTLLSACVTINVYFPAAAAEKAAEQFVGKIIGNNPPPPEDVPPPPKDAPQAGLLDFFIGAAHAAEPDLNLQTPALGEIQARMKQRFDASLAAAFAAGKIGLTRDGLIGIRDPAAVGLAERASLNQAVSDENGDRKAVYREIASANGHPEWESQIRATFARQWIEQARPGWYYQDASGAWKQR